MVKESTDRALARVMVQSKEDTTSTPMGNPTTVTDAGRNENSAMQSGHVCDSAISLHSDSENDDDLSSPFGPLYQAV